jgi:hypothetical protein
MADHSDNQLVVEAGAIESFDFSSSFFDPLPTDLRLESTKYQSYKPVGDYSNTFLTFSLPQLKGNELYRLKDALIRLDIKLTDSKGAPPPPLSNVSTCQQILYSMFSEVEVQLNHTKVTKDSGGYSYMAYLQNLFNFGFDAKNSQLQSVGWYDDVAKMYTNFAGNTGLCERRNRFAETIDEHGKVTKYSSRPICFMGKLILDLNRKKCDILSGIRVDIKMTYSTNSFRVVTDVPGNEQWKLTISDATLEVPVSFIYLFINLLSSSIMHYTLFIGSLDEP